MADENVFELVKQRNKIEDVINESYPLEQRRGRYLRGRREDCNSLVVDVANQAYHWNSQAEHGDVINWVMNRQGVDAKTAVEILCRRAGLPEPNWGRQDAATRLAARAREDAFDVATRVFARWLWDDEEALAYARGRGWTDETIRGGMLGYSGRYEGRKALRDELKRALVGAGVDLESAGAVAVVGFAGDVARWAREHDVKPLESWVEKGYISGFVGQDMLVYPQLYGGKVRYMTGRGVHEKRSWNLPEALAGKRWPYMNWCWSQREGRCVIVEGPADAVTLGQWEIPGMAMMGTKLDDHGAALMEGHEMLYLWLDADEAGQQAAWNIADQLGPMVRVIDWGAMLNEIERCGEDGAAPPAEAQAPPPKDANDILKIFVETGLDHDAQVKAVEKLLTDAEPFVVHAASWAGGKQGAERDSAQEIAFRLIARLDQVRASQYRNRLAEALGLTVREYDQVLKAVAATVKNTEKGKPLDIDFTFGGYIQEHLVEYLYDPVSQRSRLCWRDPDGKIVEGDHLDIDGKRYLPEPPDAFVRGEGCLFPSKLGGKKNTRELVRIVEMFIRKNYLFDDPNLPRIIAYYVMLTWVYDSFNALPYLRALGEPGAGKSELMRRVGHVCYRMMAASGAATAASLFRTVEMYRGTVFIDEADLHDGGDATNDIVKFLNLGAMRGNPIWRLDEATNMDGKRVFKPALYQTFCPKLISMRRDFKDDAVGTRSITLKLMPREPIELVKAGVHLNIDDDFKLQALEIRNLLLRWRMESWQPQIQVHETDIDLEISSRLNQVTMPLLALAAEDEDLKREIRQFLREYNAEIVLTRSMTLTARVVDAMWKIYKYPDLRIMSVWTNEVGMEYMMIGDVAKITNEIIDDMNKLGDDEDDEGEESKRPKRKKDEISARRVGSIIRNELQLRVGQRITKGFPVYWDGLKMEALAKRYGTEIPAVEAAAAGDGKEGEK